MKNRYLLCGLLMVSMAQGAENDSVAAPPTEKFKAKDIDTAMSLMGEGDFPKAQKILDKFIATMPLDWTAEKEEKNNIAVAFWDMNEFFFCANKISSDKKKNVSWVDGPSYSKAYYMLAFMAIEMKKEQDALGYIEQALLLDPKRADLLNEKATILLQRGSGGCAEALVSYEKALDPNVCSLPESRSRTLRGKGVCLIELGKLDEAESSLKASLALDPENKSTINELEYIKQLRATNLKRGLNLELRRVK